MGRSGQSLGALLAQARAAFPPSGEINFRVQDAAATVAKVEQALAAEAVRIDRLDGLSMQFDQWRLNLRSSNTEPLLRLNVETRGNPAGLAECVARVTALIVG